MTFGQAISSGFANITNFEGRSSRAAFWWWALLILIVDVAASIVTGGSWRGGFWSFLWWIVVIVLTLATIAVGCRRLHDTGKSGWLQLLLIIPCVGLIIMIVLWIQPGDPNANAYGSPPTE